MLAWQEPDSKQGSAPTAISERRKVSSRLTFSKHARLSETHFCDLRRQAQDFRHSIEKNGLQAEESQANNSSINCLQSHSKNHSKRIHSKESIQKKREDRNAVFSFSYFNRPTKPFSRFS
jgi:hypothetical protein